MTVGAWRCATATTMPAPVRHQRRREVNTPRLVVPVQTGARFERGALAERDPAVAA